MINLSRWTVILTLVVCVLGVAYAAPNFLLSAGDGEDLPGFVPSRQMNLGLDLQGGSHLLLHVETDVAIRETLESMESAVRRALLRGGERIGYTGLGVSGDAVVFRLRNPADADAARDRIANIDSQFVITVQDEVNFRLSLSEEAVADRRQSALEQSIEIVRRRVDETGVAEPLIQQQGADRILVQLPGIRDPERIKRLLGRTAKLTFHLIDENASVTQALQGRVPAGAMLLYGEESGQRVPYVVRRAVEVGGDRLVDAQPSFQDGQPVVSFRFDAVGGRQFGEITTNNIGNRLAIVLDREVVSAPVIRGAIVGGSGIITGRFTVTEVNDLSLVLRAGALPAPLVILEERTVGPGLGRDSIEAGKIASIVGFVLVVMFVIASYGLFGLMAGVALIFNMALIVALLSLLQATLTLPGIAGIVLTIGMAVDANVLILERIREETRLGRTPISAVDAGYRRALTTIIDSNLTTLIAALLLFQFGSGPIKGFAVTLSIGILCSMFTAIMLTRLMIVTWLRRRRPQTLPV